MAYGDDDDMTGDPGHEPMFADPNWEPDAEFGAGAVPVAPALLPQCMALLAGVKIPPRQWVVQDWLPAKSVTLLAGGGGTGKSLFTQQWLSAIALGEPMLGMAASVPTPCLYVNCEDEPDELARRNFDIAGALRCRVDDFADFYTLSRAGEEGNELGTFSDARTFRLSPFFGQIEALLVALKIGVLALDNVAHLYTGNENVRGEVTQFVNALSRLAIRHNCAVILLGHPAKGEDSTYSGSTGWENAVRNRLFLTRPKACEGQEINPDERVLSREKSNYAQKDATVPMVWMKGAFVVPDEAPEPDYSDPTSAAGMLNEVFLACLSECTKQQRAVSASPNAMNYAPRVFVKMPAAKRASKDQLEAAMERLLMLGKVAASQPLWLNPKDRHPVVGIARVAQ